jgi:flagellar assembly factor FliW
MLEPPVSPPQPVKLTVRSRVLGELTVTPGEIITFPRSLPGFPGLTRFILIFDPDQSPFGCLQSVDDPDLFLVVLDPAQMVPDYQLGPLDSTLKELAVESTQDLKVLVILTIPRGRPQEATANLSAPLLLNLKKGLGKQMVLEKPQHSLQHSIFKR